MIDDKSIIESYFMGKTYSVNLLIEKYKNLLYKLCNNLTKNSNDSDDLFQDTWMKAFKNLDKYDLNKSFETWLYTICINTYKDKYNKRKRWINVIKDYFSNEEKEDDFNKISKEDDSPEISIVRQEESENLKNCLNSLDDIFRIPLILFYFKEISYKEIAEILEIPIGTVKSRINLGKKKMKSLLEEEYYEG